MIFTESINCFGFHCPPAAAAAGWDFIQTSFDSDPIHIHKIMAKPIDFLATCPLFAKLADDERAACRERMTERMCPKGSKIIVANAIATEFFLIKSGTCDVTQDGGGFLETLVPGNYFGGVCAIRMS
jgi:CRP-like cAMP-binding protein